jgi:hypothetical protein
MDMEKLLEILHERGLLQKLPDKRLTTTPLPITHYIELIISATATGKSVTANVGTAIQTYLSQNRADHLIECKAKAMSLGKSVEEFVADQIAQRLGE